MMAAALGPPEVIAQLENAAKVLMVSAPPRPGLRAAAPPPPLGPDALAGPPGSPGEAARHRRLPDGSVHPGDVQLLDWASRAGVPTLRAA